MTNSNTTTAKSKVGTVVSNKMQKTVVVNVNTTMPHPRYGKVITRGKKYYAHNENLTLEVGDKVVIVDSKPISKLKKWRVIEKVTA